MRRALREAERAAEKGEVPVGAVVVRGEEVLASAHNEREATKDPTAHAELLAIRRAAHVLGGWRPPAAPSTSPSNPAPPGALHAARINRLVYAASDPKAGAAGSLYDLPADPRLNHTYPYTAESSRSRQLPSSATSSNNDASGENHTDPHRSTRKPRIE